LKRDIDTAKFKAREVERQVSDHHKKWDDLYSRQQFVLKKNIDEVFSQRNIDQIQELVDIMKNKEQEISTIASTLSDLQSR